MSSCWSSSWYSGFNKVEVTSLSNGKSVELELHGTKRGCSALEERYGRNHMWRETEHVYVPYVEEQSFHGGFVP
jgi:hypothetical protein